jgi:NAD(P)-dependent dehydrogenase (short-subunit alcohol dehydrogenase family)
MTVSQAKVAFITGANRGIGFETAKELVSRGVVVVLCSRNFEKAVEAAEKIDAKNDFVIPFKLDVDNLDDHQNAYDFIDKKFGKLDILINNAGILIDYQLPEVKTSHVSQDLLRKTFDTNFFNVVALTQKLLPLIKKAPSGRIVNLSSILGSLTNQQNPKSMVYNSQTFAYNASKIDLNAFTVHLANELKDTNIKVNSAHPGWVKTDMGGANAPIEVKDGCKTSVRLALLDDHGPTGGFFHLDQTLAW